jgi:hypothetical protein
MSETKRRGLARVAAVVVLTIGALFLYHLAGQALATRQARRVEAEQRAEVASLATQVAAVQTATHRAGTDPFVENWAYNEKHWARPGDHLLVPVAPTPTAAPATTPIAPDGENALDRLLRWLGNR